MEHSQTLIGHSDSVFAVAFSPKGEYLASGSRDGTMILWRTDSAKPQHQLHLGGHVVGLSFSSDGTMVAAGNTDGKIVVLSTDNRKQIRSFRSGSLESLAFRPNSNELFAGRADGRILSFATSPGKSSGWNLRLSPRQILAMSFSQDGTTLGISTGAGTLSILSCSSRSILRSFALGGYNPTIYRAVLSKDGCLCFASLHTKEADLNGIVDRYEVCTWDFSREPEPDRGSALVGHLGWIGGLDYANDRQLVASGSFDETVRLWDPNLNIAVAELKTHEGAVYGVCFSPDEKYLASCSADRTVQLHSVTSLGADKRARSGSATIQETLFRLRQASTHGQSPLVVFARDIVDRMRHLGSEGAIERELYLLFSQLSPAEFFDAGTAILRAVGNRAEQEYRAANASEARFFHSLQLYVDSAMRDIILQRSNDFPSSASPNEAPNLTEELETAAPLDSGRTSPLPVLSGDGCAESLTKIIENVMQFPESAEILRNDAMSVRSNPADVEEALKVLQPYVEAAIAGGGTVSVRKAAEILAAAAKHHQLTSALCQLLSIMGIMYSLEDDFAAAVPLFEEALEHARSLNVPLTISACSGDLANAYRNVGRLADARELYREALKCLPEGSSVEVTSIKINHLANLALVYSDLGDYADERRCLVQARTAARAIRSDRHLATISNSLGNLYQSIGDYQGALDAFREALTSATQLQDIRLRTGLLGNIGKALSHLERTTDAATYLKEAVKAARQLKEPAVEVNALVDLARLRAKQRLYVQSRRVIDQAITLGRRLPLSHLLQSSLTVLATIAEENGNDTTTALAALEEAADVGERLRKEIQHAEEGPNIQFRLSAIYLNLVRLYASIGRTSDAFWASERGRAAILLRKLRIRRPGMAAQHSSLNTQQTDLLGLVAALRRIGKNAVLITYVIIRNTLYIFALRADDGQIRCLTRSMTSAQLIAAQENFKREVVEYGSRGNVGEQWLAIGDALVEPLTSCLKENDVILMVTDHALRGLPIHALQIEGRRMIERWAMTYLPSAFSLLVLLDELPMPPRKRSVLGIHFTEEAKDVAHILDTSPRFLGESIEKQAFSDICVGSDLIHVSSYGFFSEKGAQTSGLFLKRSDQVDHYLRARDKEGFERTQGEVLALTAGEGSTCDFIFSSVDAEKLDLKAQLVTLSSCESGLANTDVSNDPTGLLPAFLVSGANGVLASLWLVDPEVTKNWMSRFYTELQRSKTWAEKPQAVRAAALDVMASYPHPYFWAAFILVGGVAVGIAGQEVLEDA